VTPVVVTRVYDAELRHKELVLERVWRAMMESRETVEVRIVFLDRQKLRNE
jgi:hypothetical protein